jgi:hypothetical protein
MCDPTTEDVPLNNFMFMGNADTLKLLNLNLDAVRSQNLISCLRGSDETSCFAYISTIEQISTIEVSFIFNPQCVVQSADEDRDLAGVEVHLGL